MRLDFDKLAPDFSKALGRVESASGQGPLDGSLRDLVKAHASQINGCAYCVDMHTKDARAAGESEQRLYALPVWREVPYFDERERAALALTEAVTVPTRAGVPDDVWAGAAKVFDEAELAQLLATIVAINAWNRIGVAARCWTPGSYQP